MGAEEGRVYSTQGLAEGGGESMSVEENLKVIEAATKVMNDHDLDRFESLHLNSVIQRDPQHPEGIKGVKAIRAGLEPFLKAFPDIRLVTERTFGAGDWVTQLSHMRATHTGPLEVPGGPTIPATNKSVRLPVALVARIEGGKFAEINLYFDQMGLMAQLGLAPQAPPQQKP
jgi:predicted ester cyclase